MSAIVTAERTPRSALPDWAASAIHGASETDATLFYEPPPAELPEEARKLLRVYSGIKPAQILPHVLDMVTCFPVSLRIFA